MEYANRAYDSGDKTCIRSMHPTHSVVAFGENAVEYVKDDENAASPMPQNGSYAKLYKNGAKILLIGVGLMSNTYIHYIDEFMAPEELSAPYQVTAIDYEGNSKIRTVGNCRGPAASYVKYLPFLEEAGAVAYGKVGDADVMVCDAKKSFDCIVKVWKGLR